MNTGFVVTLVAGRSARREIVFEPGISVPMLLIGQRAPWQVSASGVAPIHVALAYNGESLFVGAPGDAALDVDGEDIRGQGWTLVRRGAIIDAGEARFLISKRFATRPSAEDVETLPAKPSVVARAFVATGPHDSQARTRIASPTPPRQGSSAAIRAVTMPSTSMPIVGPFATDRHAPPTHLAPPPSPLGDPSWVPPSPRSPQTSTTQRRPRFDLRETWRSASPVKKATLALLLPLVVVFALSARHATTHAHAATRGTASARVAPLPPRPAESARAEAAAPSVTVASRPPIVVAPTPRAGLPSPRPKERTPERRALDAAAAGDPTASEQYAALVADHPGNPAFVEAARILAARRSR